MTDTLTLAALLEDVAETLWQRESVRATERPRRVPWSDVNEPEKAKWRDMARAALAAVAKAAGGREACETVGIAAQVAGKRVDGKPDQFLLVATLLRTLAEAAPQEARDG